MATKIGERELQLRALREANFEHRQIKASAPAAVGALKKAVADLPKPSGKRPVKRKSKRGKKRRE